ncbi:MAG: DUF1622 domain-containing protein [Xenococcaceae cyanobacterium MO_207.B15]|nr:DUF1622 domain-containing protein [Xenococcaceae cyanobacterium MO_207.B15]
MEWIKHLESNLAVIIGLLKLVLETAAALCVVLGFVTTTRLALRLAFRFQEERLVLLRLRFGSWLSLALECQLGADILATTIAPTWEALGQLGALALIRTFLNYFLNKELEAEAQTKSFMNKTKD